MAHSVLLLWVSLTYSLLVSLIRMAHKACTFTIHANPTDWFEPATALGSRILIGPTLQMVN